MTKDEALRLALDALGWTDDWRPQGLKAEAIAAAQEALAERPAQGFKEIPIGNYVLRFWPSDNGWMCGITNSMMDALKEQQAQQSFECPRCGHCCPPQRKPLTDKEIEKKWSEAMADTEHQTYLPIKEFARAIEAAHGIKE